MGENLGKGVDPTFVNLKNQLAAMYGASGVADFQTIDQERVGIYVNPAYRECYAPIDGSRPPWAASNFGFRFPEPVSITLTLTNGDAESSTSGAAVTDYPGSYIKFGTDFYVFAGVNNSGNIVLQTPWKGTTGSHTGTFYYSAHVMDREVIDVCPSPELVGVGAMSPLNSPEAETRLRSSYATDFLPARIYGNIPSITYNGAEVETDDNPLFYFVDTSNLLPKSLDADLATEDTMSARPRFHVYPVPNKEITVRLKANVMPLELSVDADVARLPGNVVWDILYPIACAKLVMSDPRYNGDNREMVLLNAKEARQRLSTLAKPQQQRTIRLRKRSGY